MKNTIILLMLFVCSCSRTPEEITKQIVILEAAEERLISAVANQQKKLDVLNSEIEKKRKLVHEYDTIIESSGNPVFKSKKVSFTLDPVKHMQLNLKFQ